MSTRTRASSLGGHDYKLILNSETHQFPATQAGLQAAINDLSVNGGWVKGPGMRTRIDVVAAIVLPSNVKLSEVYIYVANGANCNGIQNSDPVGGNEYIEICHSRVNANKENQTATNNAIYMENVSQPWVHHCIVRGGRRVAGLGGEGIWFNKCTNGIISNNYGYEAYYDDIKCTNGSRNSIIGNTCFGASDLSGGIQVATGEYYPIIANNNIWKTGADHDNAGKGIKIHSSLYAVVSGNRVYGANIGVDLIESSDYCVITGNHVYHAGIAGIMQRTGASINVEISGNYIKIASDQVGIELEKGDGHQIHGNVISSTGGIPGTTVGIKIDANVLNTNVFDNSFLSVATPIVDNGTGTRINNNEGNVGHYQTADYGAAWVNWIAGITGVARNGTRCVFYNTNGAGAHRLGCYSNGAWHYVDLI